MKKLLLITIILLLQSYPSFGNPNGKGIICNFEKKTKDRKTYTLGFKFKDNKVEGSLIDKQNDEFFITNSEEINFTTTEKKIEWGSIDYRFELDRKNLKLKSIEKTTILGYFQCEVNLEKIYLEKMIQLKNQYQSKYNEQLKKLDNKI